MVKTTWKSDLPWSAIFSIIVYYDWKHAAVYTILLQTLIPKLQEPALQDNVYYEDLLNWLKSMQSGKGSALLENAVGQSSC